MNCKTCDYPLWNLKTRQCPECGTAFMPGEFDFVINSTRFCCPHCDQCYFGTNQRGHLVPSEFICVQCGQPISMSQMVLRPAEGVSEQQTRVDHMPWLERAHRPWFKRFFLTIIGGMFGPVRMMRAVPKEGSTGTAWMFALQCFGIFLLCGIGLPFLVIGLIQMLSRGSQATEPLVISAAVAFGGTAGLMGVTGLWALAAHGLLRISGGANEPLGRTTQAFCFSAGTLSMFAFPCLGIYCLNFVGAIWWVISATLMLAEAQKVHGGRAAFAVITPVLTVAVIAGAVLFGGLYFASISNPMMFNAATATPQWETRIMAQNIVTYAAANNGQGPPHAAQLVIDNSLGADNFMAMMSGNSTVAVPVADTTLDKFERLPTNRKQLAAQAAAKALPPSTIAHRMGDFVFTYHGINLNNPDPNLWLVVLIPEQGPGGAPVVIRPVVGQADGTSRQITGSFSAELAAQNSLRKSIGLPALPDLATVTHRAPAVANAALPINQAAGDD